MSIIVNNHATSCNPHRTDLQFVASVEETMRALVEAVQKVNEKTVPLCAHSPAAHSCIGKWNLSDTL